MSVAKAAAGMRAVCSHSETNCVAIRLVFALHGAELLCEVADDGESPCALWRARRGKRACRLWEMGMQAPSEADMKCINVLNSSYKCNFVYNIY